ncbi:hypothetical protein BUALT_Bualt07G0099600 [Buddleja alternifolia]|uniref:Agenet domain-containing protein n=1 Tax=Buddleja alternifolia TaxID=168488 RepID=A0AAV6XK60_9LAMI|nr:hypothetical protein BUALT_Bualt07G0099600 [Buddleja alternifolia]
MGSLANLSPVLPSVWIPPPVDWVRINFDGAVFSEHDGIGTVYVVHPTISTAVDSATSATTNPQPSPATTTTNPLTKIHHFLSLKLTPKNYLLWRIQILPLIKGLRLVGYIDGTYPSPPSHHLDPDSNQIVPNPAFSQWEQQDNLLMSALLNSLTEEVVCLVVGATTSHAIWKTLEHAFASPSQARIMQLRLQLQSLKQGDLSIQSYLQQAQSLADKLAAVGQPLNIVDFNLYIFKGLRSQFRDSVTTLTAKAEPPPILSSSVFSLIKNFSTKTRFSISPLQIRPLLLQPKPLPIFLTEARPLLITVGVTTANWFPDTGASHHVTSDVQSLSSVSPYHGTDNLQIGHEFALRDLGGINYFLGLEVVLMSNGVILSQRRDSIEVCSKEEGFLGSYYEAIIVAKITRNNQYVVEYKTLVEDDLSAPLREVVSADEVRPPPPPPERPPMQFFCGDRIDAFDNDGWWVGTVSGMNVDEGKYYVYFELFTVEIAYHPSKLRLHQNWNKGKWSVSFG